MHGAYGIDFSHFFQATDRYLALSWGPHPWQSGSGHHHTSILCFGAFEDHPQGQQKDQYPAW